jgi:hypothetical protein
LPREARNRLAELIIRALSDDVARRELQKLADTPVVPERWLAPDETPYAETFAARVQRAARTLRDAPVFPRVLATDDALAAAAHLFDAGLYFETHEVLEPAWRDAGGDLREMLQGLIQIAVGYQHLANGNLAGASALLEEGAERLRRTCDEGARARDPEGRVLLASRELPRFVAGVAASLDEVRHRSAATRVPPFPALDPGA